MHLEPSSPHCGRDRTLTIRGRSDLGGAGGAGTRQQRHPFTKSSGSQRLARPGADLAALHVANVRDTAMPNLQAALDARP